MHTHPSYTKTIIVVLAVIGILVAISQHMYVLPIHIATFFLTILAVIIADFHGLLWVLGKLPTLPKKRMLILHRIISLGLLTAVTTGALMAYPVYDYLLAHPPFLAKLVFVGALIVNSFVIASHMDLALTTPFKDVPMKKRIPLFISGAVSTTCWIGAFIAAQFIGLS